MCTMLGPKTKIYTKGDRVYKVSSFDLSLKKQDFKKRMSQSDETLPSYVN